MPPWPPKGTQMAVREAPELVSFERPSVIRWRQLSSKRPVNMVGKEGTLPEVRLPPKTKPSACAVVLGVAIASDDRHCSKQLPMFYTATSPPAG